MNNPITPEELLRSDEFELLAEIDHRHIKQFIWEQINPDINLIRWFSAYQIALVALFVFLLTKSILLSSRGLNDALIWLSLSVLFSFSLLIVIHELLHALAYWITGARNLKAGAIWRKFVFYVAADRQVINKRSFRLVAYAPLVVVQFASLMPGILFWKSPQAYFFFGIMCIHSLFCAGDMAMLAFYQSHADKEILTFDDIATGKSYFYFRK